MNGDSLGYKPIVSITCSAIIIFFQLIFIISLSHKFCACSSQQRKDSEEDDYNRRPAVIAENRRRKIVQCTSLSVFIFLALSFSCWIIDELLYRLEAAPPAVTWTFFWLYFMFLGVSYILFYILLLQRLRHSFEGSDFEISSTVYRMHIANMVFLFVMGIICVFIRMVERYEAVFYVLAVLVFLSCLLSAVHLITVFNQGLFDLTLGMRRRTVLSELSDNKDNEDGVDIEITEHQHKLLRLIRKQSLLAGIIFVMMIINLVGIAVYAVYEYYPWWWLLWCITLTVGTWCVYLQFAWTDGCYRAICGRCDMRVATVCERMAGRKIVMLKMMSLDRMRNEQDLESNRTDVAPIKLESTTMDQDEANI